MTGQEAMNLMNDMEEALQVITGRVKGDIRASLAFLDKVVADSSESLPPRLLHFLERRSYVKALAFLEEGEEAES